MTRTRYDSGCVQNLIHLSDKLADGRQIMTAGQRTVPREQMKLKFESKNVTLSQVFFWDLKSGKRAAVLNGDEDYGFGYAALSPDGKTVAVGDFSRLNFWEVGSKKLVRTVTLPGWWGRQPVFSPDGALVAIAIDNAIGLFEVSTGRRLHHEDSTPVGNVISGAWSPDGDRIITAATCAWLRTAKRWLRRTCCTPTTRAATRSACSTSARATSC